MRIISVVKKDILEGIRNYKFLIILAVFIFFAILDPVMNKYILPQILKSQFQGISEEIMNSMVDMSQIGSIRSYLGDINEMGMIIIIFVLCGLISGEIKEKTLIMPLCSGKRFSNIILSKLVVYGAVAFFSSIIGAIVNYFYSSLLFSFDLPDILPSIKAGALEGLFLMFIISLLIFIGTLTDKSILVGLLTFAFILISGFLGSSFKLLRFTPSGLIEEAMRLTTAMTSDLLQNLIVIGGATAIFISIAIIRISRLELTKRC